MGTVAIAAAIMTGLGLVFSGLLATASRYLRVDEDPRLDPVEGMLPGTNCGACGEPGCRAFAEALVRGTHPPSKCTVSSPDGIQLIAGFLGVAAGERIKRVARLHCAGGKAQAQQIAAYEGFSSCRASSLVAAGGKGCSWGCLVLGDCQRICDFDAIAMNGNALPVVDVALCTACGDCVDVCPRDLFEILPVDQPLLVQCNTPLRGDEAMALCTVACDACGRCAQDAATGLINMTNNLPQVQYASLLKMGPEATFRCPTGAIQWLPGGQFATERAIKG